jgi:hypothetical protein
MSIDDGLQWFKNKAKKIEDIFAKSFALNIKEGNEGMNDDPTQQLRSLVSQQSTLGPSVLTPENINNIFQTELLTKGYDDKVSEAKKASDAFIEKTTEYASQKGTLNYNVFVNRTVGSNGIIESLDPSKCASRAILNGGGLTEVNDTFYKNAYPYNFSSYSDAKKGCKLWAADSGASYFAVSKSQAGNKYTCYTGSSLTGKPEQYTVPQVAVTVASSNDATRGGLFYDGTIGIYNDRSNASNKNIQIMKGQMVPTGYSSCDRWIGGALNTSSINAELGRNCSNSTDSLFNTRYITIKASKIRGQDNWLQISQVGAFAYNDQDGSGKNVAPTGIVTNNRGNKSYENRYPITESINGDLSSRPDNYFYHSPAPTSIWDYWQLDLKQEYPIYKIEFYTRSNCCQGRTDGATLVLENADRTKVITRRMSGVTKQLFTIGSQESKPNPIPTPHLENMGKSVSWSDSQIYAQGKGGRLATAEELLDYIRRNGGVALVPGIDMWAAVTNGYNNQNDYIQIGSPPNPDPGHVTGASHIQYFNYFPGWGAANYSFNRYVFWVTDPAMT